MESVLAQTFSDIELFIIGDDVDNDTRAVIHDLMAHDSKIKYLRQSETRTSEPKRHSGARSGTLRNRWLTVRPRFDVAKPYRNCRKTFM